MPAASDYGAGDYANSVKEVHTSGRRCTGSRRSRETRSRRKTRWSSIPTPASSPSHFPTFCVIEPSNPADTELPSDHAGRRPALPKEETRNEFTDKATPSELLREVEMEAAARQADVSRILAARDSDPWSQVAGRPLVNEEKAIEMGLMKEPGKLAALREGIARIVGTVLGIITIPGAVYLTFWRWDTAWPWVLIPAGSWILVALLRRYVIGNNLLLVAPSPRP